MSGSKWVITPSWLYGSCRYFLYSSSVYSCHLFLISSYVRSISFLSFIEPIFAWNVSLVSLIFLKRSLVFPILLFSSICTDHLRRLSYPSCYSLELCIQMGFPCDLKSTCDTEDLDSILGLGRSPGEGKGYPLQYSGRENSMDCIVHGVAKSRTQLSETLRKAFLFLLAILWNSAFRWIYLSFLLCLSFSSFLSNL